MMLAHSALNSSRGDRFVPAIKMRVGGGIFDNKMRHACRRPLPADGTRSIVIRLAVKDRARSIGKSHALDRCKHHIVPKFGLGYLAALCRPIRLSLAHACFPVSGGHSAGLFA